MTESESLSECACVKVSNFVSDQTFAVSPIISMQTVNDIERAPNTVGTIAPNTQALILDPEGKGACRHEERSLLYLFETC
jgi:hypothetical protein